MPRRAASIALLLLACALSYANVFRNSFTRWDDDWLIFENPYIQELSVGNVGALFDPFRDRANLGAEYLPVRDLSWAVDHTFWGGNPVGFHVGDLLLHALVSCGVWILLRFLLPGGEVAALLGALLFAVHPVHTESVTWMSGRKDVLSGTFALLALCLAARRGRVDGAGRIRLTASLTLLHLLAVLSKSTTIILPLLLMLQDLALGRVRRGLPGAVGLVVRYSPLLAVSFAVSLVVTMTSGSSGLRVSTYHGGSLLATLWIQSRAFLDYACVLLLPVELRTGVVVPKIVVFDAAHVVAALFVLLLVSVAVRWVLRRVAAPTAGFADPGDRLGFSAAFFLVALLPVSNLIPMNWVYCERYLYLPSIAFCLLAGSVGARLLERSGYRGGVRVALVLIFVALVARTHLRNRDWVDDLSLWTVTARQSPHDHDVLYNYAKSLEVASRERHRDEEERRVLRDRAILTHERALALEPGRPESRVNLAPLLLRRRGPGDLQRARDILEEGLGYGDDAQLRNNLAVVLRALGDEDGALLAFGRAFGLDSAFGGAYAEALHRKGRNDEAAEVLGRVLEEREDDVLLLRLAALVARARGRKGEALEYVRRALRLDPERKGLRLLQEELLGEQ